MKNNRNDASKRTAAQIKAILKSNGVEFLHCLNTGDNRYFDITFQNMSLKHRVSLKLVCNFLIDSIHKNTITIKCH